MSAENHLLFFAEESYSMVSPAVLGAKNVKEERVYVPVEGLVIEEEFSEETEILTIDLDEGGRNEGIEREREREMKEIKEKGRKNE